MTAISRKLRSPLLHVFIIAVLACLAYANSFAVPFHFDDKLNILDNPLIKDLSNFWPPSGVRWFGYLTFALNYAYNGLDPRGYHAVNLAIHVLNALLVYRLLLLTFKTPWYRNRDANENERTRQELTALLAALLFALHPIQTQAVTYIVQRFASLATLFYLLSLTAYIEARLAAGRSDGSVKTGVRISFFYAVALLSAVLAMKTKEISFTLPVVIILYEFSFFTRERTGKTLLSKKLLFLLPLALTMAIIPFTMTGFSRSIQAAFTATNEISRHDYLVTQFRVLVTYLRLLLLPIGQSIDHDYPLYREFLAPPVLFSFLFLTLITSFAVFLFVRSRPPRAARLIAFGIFWFFITISVESSIVPIADIMFEHRLYLPSVGAAAAAAAGMAFLAEKLQNRYRHASGIFMTGGIVLIVSLTAAAYNRNTVWQSEISLWENAVGQYPKAARAQSMLGIQYGAAGRRSDAVNAYRRAIAAKPSFAEAHVNLGSAYMDEGLLDDAMNEFMTAAALRNMDETDTAYLYINMGYCFLKKGMPDRAIEFYQYAERLIPDEAQVYFFQAGAYQAKGMNDRARALMARAHQLNPDRY